MSKRYAPKYRKNNDFEDDEIRVKRNDGRRERKLSYEEILEQYEEETALEYDNEDDML